ncbi:MAG: hypothetical protein ACT4P8_21020 [Betaproteobacteria bacterium]
MRSASQMNAKRREVMIAGLAGVSAMLNATPGTLLAQNLERTGKIDTKRMEPVASMIPGIAKVQVRASTYQPGAMSKSKMQNAMICECTQGTLEITQDDHKPFIAKTGHMWTCDAGTIEVTSNKGTTPATMRVIDLLKA